MKNPKTIKAIAVVDSKKPKLSVLDIYQKTDQFAIDKNERKCVVEIVFKKWVK